jgi:aryl-alcohol dehydrogenase-like predicted oxidoreductase
MRLTGTGIWGEPKDVDEAKRVLKRAVELGVNFIDTADSYGPAVSERLIGEALSPFPKGLVVATKGGLTRQGPMVPGRSRQAGPARWKAGCHCQTAWRHRRATVDRMAIAALPSHAADSWDLVGCAS